MINERSRRRGPVSAVHRRRRRVAMVAGGAVATLLALMIGLTAFIYWKSGQFRHTNVTLDAPGAGTATAQNYLIIGSDSRASIDPASPDAGGFTAGAPQSGQRSDTIMIARVDARAGAVTLLSIPRDLYVPIAGTGSVDRINSAYDHGPQVLIDTIRQDLGIPINHYVEVNFRGFQSIVDTLGGVPYYAPASLRDANTGLNLPGPGCMTLNGTQALELARSRHLTYLDAQGQWASDPSSDFGRMARQQMLVRAVAKRALGLNIGNAVTAYHLLDAAVHSLTVDQTIGRSELVSLARRFQRLDTTGIAGASVPTRAHRTPAGADVLLLDAAQARPVLNPFRGLPNDAISEADVQVSVVALTKGGGSALLTQFRAAGFMTGSATVKTATRSQPLVRFGPSAGPAAQLVARHLLVTPEFREDPNLGPDQVTVVFGAGGAGGAQVVATRSASVAGPVSSVPLPTASAPPPSTPLTAPAIGVTPPCG